MKVTKIKKRTGEIVHFQPSKITKAISKAVLTTDSDKDMATRISKEVVEKIHSVYSEKNIPTVEDIQDIVEKTLVKHNLPDVAKSYILYRNKQSEKREIKEIFGVSDDLKLRLNSIKVLRERYLAKNEEGEIIETPSELFLRVAKKVAKTDTKYEDINVDELEKIFFKTMVNLDFLPNSPTLMNAGLDVPQQLSACFVLPLNDSLESIFNSIKNMALIHKSGGGTGFSFSHIRPKGDIVKTTKGIASGPLSFMKVFDVTTDVVKQGGRRRGANMGVLRFDHPDVIEFITAKDADDTFENFNLSVGVTDEFIKAVKRDESIDLVNPRTNKKTKRVAARYIFDLITYQAWKTGDPGLLFLDEINRYNPTPEEGIIEASNPCGEVPLLVYESCNLGSINLSNMISEDGSDVDWEKLRKTVRTGIHFLDNIIDVNEFPLPEIEEKTKGNRKIGLGVMGFAELLIQLNIPYDSNQALGIAKELMQFINDEARKKSEELGKMKGSFPNFKKSIYNESYEFMRNATVTTIAPTGTISVIAGCSSGIEPLFGIAFVRNIMGGKKFFEVNSLFEKSLKEKDLYSNDLIKRIARKGSVKDIDELPEDIKSLYVTALDINPSVHVMMQSAFQEFTDNAVSKTVNLPNDASLEQVKNIFLKAFKLNCKGITLYRYGTKKNQVLSIADDSNQSEYFNVESDYSGGCPTSGGCNM
ncbi:MAG TPA: adenosylcobalamin-dependent ribonucleoside-diphosphate reductase [Candidatus Thermoplasmatota archaeon]|nr:adenosylcobalamin-dependent ribonucleoside-diphosphate reductase [Candidatus Thermoplasmatota archaeon]